uniref:Uncharacterized protein n=1 Tax=Rhizophora mucronata TaxID=61149 RepID=A0A2P2P2V4_RHIMU
MLCSWCACGRKWSCFLMLGSVIFLFWKDKAKVNNLKLLFHSSLNLLAILILLFNISKIMVLVSFSGLGFLIVFLLFYIFSCSL